MKKLIKVLFVAIIAPIFILWGFIVLILPLVFNSEFFSSKISDIFYNSTGNVLYLKKYKLSINPDFSTKFFADDIFVLNENQTLNLKGLELNFSPFNSNVNKITANEIYFQKNGVSSFILKNSSKKKKNSLNFQNLPVIQVKKLIVELKSKKKTSLKFNFDDINFLNASKGKVLSFNMLAFSDYLSEKIQIKNESKIYILNDGFYTNSLKIYFFDSFAEIKGRLFDGKGGQYFLIKGKNLPASDIEKCTILILKRINPKKYFIENFKDFTGKLDLCLYYENKELFGHTTLKKLGAKTRPLSIPLFFKKADFIFDKKTIVMKTTGLFGFEKAETDLYITGLFTSNLETSGSIHSYVTNNFAKKYIEGLFIKGKVLLNVDYYVKNGVVNVIYKASLDKFSDIYYLKSRLGLWNLKREIVATTEKTGDIIRLLKYSYLVEVNGKQTEIIMGDGLFTKHSNKKFAIDKISLKTRKNAPVSLLGFIESNLRGGRFNGNIEYDFIKSKLNGSLILSNSRFKGFLINEAAIFANKNTISILTNGTFKGEIYNAIIELKNSLKDNLLIYDFDIFLKSFELVRSNHKKRKFKPFFNEIEVSRRIDVEKLKLRLDEFKKENILIKNLVLNGYVENNVLFFNMNGAKFANGILGAFGSFDFNKKCSEINFSAQNIDASIAAYQVFNIKDHIKGLAGAKLKLIFFNSFREYKGTAVFSVEKGSLTKFGSKEFFIKGSRKKQPFKFSLSKIIKIDKNAELSPEVNIKGFFNFVGPQIQDINIIAHNKLISFYIEGNYNAKTQYSKLNLWGRYERELEKNISIFHIPLSFVYKFVFKVKEQKDKYFEKLLKIPSLNNSKNNQKTFSVQLEGNINDTNSLEFKFKDIR